MRDSGFYSGLVVVVGLLLISVAPAHGALVITEVMSSSGTGGTPDWFELTNTGPSAVDLTGFKMDDNSFGSPATAPVALLGVPTIEAGQTVVFIEGDGTTVAAFRTFWGGAAQTATIGTYSGSGVSLSSAGDGVTLFDASGTEVPGVRVTFGAATTGLTFEFDPAAGTFGALSAAGRDGAFTSADPLANVGSPGVGSLSVVPEPSTMGLLVVGGVLPLAARRRARRRTLA